MWQAFHRDAAGDALILNKWFSLQASADLPDQLARVRALKQHPDFSISNPNRARSLVSAFAMNMPHFHAADGGGYSFISDSIIELDALNPQVRPAWPLSMLTQRPLPRPAYRPLSRPTYRPLDPNPVPM